MVSGRQRADVYDLVALEDLVYATVSSVFDVIEAEEGPQEDLFVHFVAEFAHAADVLGREVCCDVFGWTYGCRVIEFRFLDAWLRAHGIAYSEWITFNAQGECGNYQSNLLSPLLFVTPQSVFPANTT